MTTYKTKNKKSALPMKSKLLIIFIIVDILLIPICFIMSHKNKESAITTITSNTQSETTSDERETNTVEQSTAVIETTTEASTPKYTVDITDKTLISESNLEFDTADVSTDSVQYPDTKDGIYATIITPDIIATSNTQQLDGYLNYYYSIPPTFHGNTEYQNLLIVTQYAYENAIQLYNDKIQQYIAETKNNVMYIVKPHFTSSNSLMPDYIELKAYSIADKGKALSILTKINNIDPALTINYNTNAYTY